MPSCTQRSQLYHEIPTHNKRHASQLWLCLFIILLQSVAHGQLSYTCPQAAQGGTCACTETELDCSGMALSDVPSGLGTGIQRIILRNNALSSIDIITSMNLPNLVYIDASHNNINSFDWSSFSSLTNLEELHLQMNSLLFVDISYFGASQLHTLDLSGNQPLFVNGLEYGNLLPLKHLYIENMGLSYFGASTTLCNLITLHMGNNMISTLASDAFACMSDLQTLKLNNIGQSSLPSGVFSSNSNLQSLDISYNSLATLPSTSLDGLNALSQINLSGNPWICGCDLVWLRLYIDDLVASGGTILEEDATLCSTNSQLVSLTAYNFCSQTAASCVYDFASESYAIVIYSSQVATTTTGDTPDVNTCRDTCHFSSNSYFLFENVTTVTCLCGDVTSVMGCTDCDASMAAALSSSNTMCGGQYTNLLPAAHVNHDLEISISTPSSFSTSTRSVPMIEVLEEVTFTVSGGPAGLDVATWSWGDGSTSSGVLVSHTFPYVGTFDVTLVLSDGNSNLTSSQIIVQVTVGASLSQPDMSCPSYEQRSVEEITTVSAEFWSGWGQTVAWTRQDTSSGNTGGGEEVDVRFLEMNPSFGAAVADGTCELDWSFFHNRCIKAVQAVANMNSADSACLNLGGRLLRVYSEEEIEELSLNTTLFTPGAGTTYYMGAEWATTAYYWKNTMEKAFVFRETLTSSNAGSCVQLSDSGLSSVDCTQQLGYICEKDPVACTGTESSSSQVCYVFVSTATTWDLAQQDCSSKYSNGKLASIYTSLDNSLIANRISSSSWVGLRARTLQGHYVWQDKGALALSSYSNWADQQPGPETCVYVDTSGLWHVQACDQAMAYVCQYTAGDEVNIPWKVAGWLPSDGGIGTPTPVYSSSSPSSSAISDLIILPGLWISSSGQLQSLVIETNSQSSDEELALHIWRPACTTPAVLDRPGCNSNSPLFSCVKSSTQNCASSSCGDDEVFCLLTLSCLPQSQPCTCSGQSAFVSSTIDCQMRPLNSDLPTYELVMSWTVTVPSGTTRLRFEPSIGAFVQFGDVVGLQSTKSNFVACQPSSSSQWRNFALYGTLTNGWLSVGEVIDPVSLTLEENVLCPVTGVYTEQSVSSAPGQSLNYITSPGNYELSVEADSTSVGSCSSLTVIDPIRGFLWIYPQPLQSSIVLGSTATSQVDVQAEVAVDLMIKILQGTDPSVTWTFSGMATQSTSLVTSCPSSISSFPDSCNYFSSSLSAPYSTLSHTFTSGMSPVTLTVHATNFISFSEMTITFNVYSPIASVELYHKDCQVRSGCEIYVEPNLPQEFYVSFDGDVTAVTYFENGVLVSPASSVTANHTVTFSSGEDVVLSVNVSNPFSWMTADLTVHSRIRANFVSITFDNIVDKAALGSPISISTTATVSYGASILVTWMVDDVNNTFEHTYSTTTVHPTLSNYYILSSGNITVTVLLQDHFGDNVSASMVIEVYKPIDVVAVSTSAAVIRTETPFELSILVDNTTTGEEYHYGEMNFEVDWGQNSGSVATTWTDSRPVQSVTHEIDVAGTHTVTVTVTMENDNTIVRTASVVLILQEAITGLRLKYDGPKHVSEAITFTATYNYGTDITYSLSYGDGTTAPDQTIETFLYNYSTADVYKARLTAWNEVSQRSTSLQLYAYDETLLQIMSVTRLGCVEVNTTVSLNTEVAAQYPHSLNYTWDFGNGYVQMGIGLVSVSSSYDVIGNYFASLEVENSTGSISDIYNTEICVEERITQLSVVFSSPVALQQPGALEFVLLTAMVTSGSNLTFSWTVNDVDDVGNYDVLNLNVTEPATYNITVHVQNDLNSVESFQQLVAMDVIQGLAITCLNCTSLVYCTTKRDVYFEALKDYGTHETYTWTLNDTSASQQNGTLMRHSFQTAGNYMVTLVSMNEVSSMAVSLMVFAEEEVTGVSLTVEESLALSDSNVTYQVGYESGTNLSYVWTCNGSVVPSASTDTTVLAFSAVGVYSCSVTVFNAISQDSDSVTVTILDVISSLTINHQLSPMLANTSTVCAAVNEETVFGIMSNTEFLVNFTWEVSQDTSVHLTAHGKQDLNHTFPLPGSYNVTLRAENPLSETMSVLTVRAQERVTGAQLNTSSPVYMIAGKRLALQVSTLTGSDMAYRWSMNASDLQDDTDTALIAFMSTGVFILEVYVSNDLSYDLTQVTVHVFEPVNGVSIQLSQTSGLPYVNLFSDLGLSAPTVSGSDLVFTWTITNNTGSTVLTSNVEDILYTFPAAGTYQIHLEVSNPLGFLDDSVSVDVQGPVTAAVLNISNIIIATGSLLAVSADINTEATDLTYSWSVNGVTVATSDVLLYQFMSVGNYQINLQVENNVSSEITQTTVRVLDLVTGLQISDCREREVGTSSTLYVSIISGTNTTFSWFIATKDTAQTFDGMAVNNTFWEEGVYNVTVVGSNDLGKEVITCLIEAQLPIGFVEVNLTSPEEDHIFVNHPVIFTASGGNFSFATFNWSITSQQDVVTTSNVHTALFSLSGTYKLFLTVSNGISSVNTSFTFIVRQFECNLPQVARVGSRERVVQRSHPLELEVTVDPQDCTDYIAMHEWSIYRGQGCSGSYTSDDKVDLGDITTSSPAILIPARSLEVGSYCVQFVTGYHYTSVSQSVEYEVNVTSSSLQAVIRGGTRRTVASGSNLCLNGYSSYDPDALLESVSLSYAWLCTEVNATGGCFSSQTTGSFCYQGFTAGTYQITLEVSAPGRVPGSEQQIIEALNVVDFVPTAGVVCESCLYLSNYRVSSSQHVALSATCDNCDQCSPKYHWQMFEGQQEITLDATQTSTGVDSTNLVLSKWGAIRDSTDYTFVVYVACDNSSNIGTASLTLAANTPPSLGSCYFSPTEVVPLEDQVTISCPNWIDLDDPDTPISYAIYVDTVDPSTGQNQSYPLYSGTDTSQHVYLSPNGAESVQLRVLVSDEFGASVLGGWSTITFRERNTTGSSSQSQTDYLVEQADTVLSRLTRQALPTSLLQYSIALGQQLNAESRLEANNNTQGLGTHSEQRRAAVRDAVTICVTTLVPMSTLADVQQMAYALRLLTDYSVEYLTEDSQILMMQTLGKMRDLLHSSANTGLDRGDVPTEDMLTVLLNVLSAANVRIYSAADIWADGRSVSLNDFNTDFQTLRPEISEAVSLMSFDAITLDESHRRTVAAEVVPLLEDVLISTLSTMMVGETGLDLQLDGVRVKASRAYADSIDLQAASNYSQVQLAESMLKCCKQGSQEILQVLIAHNKNPYTYGNSGSGAAAATMPVQTVSFYETDGTPITVTGLSTEESVWLYMFTEEASQDHDVIDAGNLVYSPGYDPLQDVLYKSVTINGGLSKQWTVPDLSSSVEQSAGLHIQLRVAFSASMGNVSSPTVTSYLGINRRPLVDDYDQKLVLTPSLMMDGVDHRRYTFFSSNINPTDTVYVTATNDDDSQSVELSVGIYISNCEYFETTTQLWSRSGCVAQEESTATVTSCRCNHLTSFGGAGIVSITDINFEDLDNLDIATNPAVFIALSVVLALYGLTLLICRYLDLIDLRRISKVPLCGRDGPFKYEVAIFTGRQFGSGTSAHIGLKLYGTQGKGEARHVTKSGAFQRGGRDVFHIAHRESLGELTKLLVWHDNTGLSPSWFLSHCVVKDLQTGARYSFLVDCWLSLEEEDGQVQKTVKCADEEELLRFHTRFLTALSWGFADTHVWLSVSERPDHSRFTRVQRATVLLTCVLLYMCANAVWYGAFKTRRELEETTWQNAFGWEEIIIALISVVLVVPFLLLLSFIFKRSRCKETLFQELQRPNTAQTLEIEAMCDVYSRGESFRTVTPLGDWLPAIDRESTTDSFAGAVGLKRTAPMHRFARKGSADGSFMQDQAAIVGKKELWSRDTIMQSWPDRMPTWIKQVKAQVKGQPGSAGLSSSTSQAGGPGTAANNSFISRRSSRSARTMFSGSKSVDDSDDDLQQRLDEMDAEIARDEERSKKRKISHELRQKRESTMDLFESDDEWANEGLEELQASTSSKAFNPRRDAQLLPNTDRHNCRSGSVQLSGSGVRGAPPASQGSAGSRQRDSSASQTWRDGKRHSILSASSKSKSFLSDHQGKPRSLSITTAQGMHVTLSASRQTSSMPRDKKGHLLLPHWCVYGAYIFCCMLSIVAAILVLLYGYRFGSQAALKWVVSLCCSMFVSILIIEPLRILILAVLTCFFIRDVRDDGADTIDVHPTVEANEQIKEIKFRPLGGFALLQARLEGRKKLQLQTMLREVVTFTFMFALLLAIVFLPFSGARAAGGGGAYTATNSIFSRLNINLDGTTDGTGVLNITNLKSITDFWLWSEAVLAPALHHRELQEAESWGHLMGTAWFRQLRTSNVSCVADSSRSLLSVPELVSRRCLDPNVVSSHMTDPYSPGWGLDHSILSWIFSSSDQLDMPSKFGQSTLYPGGGYTRSLGLTYNSTLDRLSELQSEGWIDLNTRAVFIEFSLYNPSHDLTSSVTVIVEFPISGGVLTTTSIQTERLLRFTSGIIDPLMVCQVIFFLFMLYLLVVLVSKVYCEGVWRFLSQAWNWADLLICLLAWAQAALYIACVVIATRQMDAFLANRSVPAQLGVAVLLHGVLRWLHGGLIFLLCFKVVKQVRFCRPLYKFYMTFDMASGPLTGVFLIFMMLLLFYAQFTNLLYGTTVSNYRSFGNSLSSLVGILGSRTDFWPLFEAHRVMTHIIFVSFAVFVYGLPLCLSVAVLSWAFRRSREQMSFKTTLEARDYEMIDFMMKRFKLLTGMDKPKPAFRKVKFAGLPSLPSRATSSNISSRQSHRDSRSNRGSSSQPSVSRRSSLCSDSILTSGGAAVVNGGPADDVEMNEAEQSIDYLMASLLPTWDQVLQTLQKVEDIDRSEENTTKQIQEAVSKNMKAQTRWAIRKHPRDKDLRLKVPKGKPIMGKPPLDPKATFGRFRNPGGSRSITVLAGRNTMTPPSTFSADSGLGQHRVGNMRPFSDQGMRRDPKFSHNPPDNNNNNDPEDDDEGPLAVSDMEEILTTVKPSYGRPPSAAFSNLSRYRQQQRHQAGRSESLETSDQCDTSASLARHNSSPVSSASVGSSSTATKRGSPGSGFFNNTRLKSTNISQTSQESVGSTRTGAGPPNQTSQESVGSTRTGADPPNSTSTTKSNSTTSKPSYSKSMVESSKDSGYTGAPGQQQATEAKSKTSGGMVRSKSLPRSNRVGPDIQTRLAQSGRRTAR